MVPFPLWAMDCPLPTQIVVQSFEGKKQAEKPAQVTTTLLKEYLELLQPKLKKKKESYQLSGQIIPIKGNLFQLKAELQPSSLHISGEFEWPQTLNVVLVSLSEQVATALEIKMAAKKWFPYLNATTSAEAYFQYSEGRSLLELKSKKTSLRIEQLNKAITLFQNAIQQDYNYVPAYLGLSEALARISALTTTTENSRLAHQSRLELEKAKILNPVLSERKQEMIETLLKKRSDPCGDI